MANGRKLEKKVQIRSDTGNVGNDKFRAWDAGQMLQESYRETFDGYDRNRNK